MVFNGSMLFGPSIGGLMIPVIDTTGCFFLATVGNLLVLVTIFLIHIPAAEPPAGKTTITRDMIDGLRLAWKTAVFLGLLTVLAAVSFCTKPYTQFMPVFTQTILNIGTPGLGMLLMAPGAGAILGGLTLASVRRFPKPANLLFRLAAGFGIAISLFASPRSFPFGLIATWIGAPWTVAICGALTISLVGSVVSYRASLRDAKSFGEFSRRTTVIAPPAQ